jgi:hypothetical protein
MKGVLLWDQIQMNYKFDVYLAGAMHGRKVKDVIEERKHAKWVCDLFEVTYYDPAADEGLDQMDPDDIIDLKPDLHTMRGYVDKDDSFVDQCQFLLVLTGDKSSSGTGWEMGRMFYQNHRSIYIVAPKMAQGLLTNFTTVKATKMFLGVEKAVDQIREDLDALHIK